MPVDVPDIVNDTEIKIPSLVIHTLEKPYLNSTCPDITIESFVNVKMNTIVSGNMTHIENNDCNGQVRTCTGYFDITGKNLDRCWILECSVSTPNMADNSGIITTEYKKCDYVKVRNNQGLINSEKALSWEIIQG